MESSICVNPRVSAATSLPAARVPMVIRAGVMADLPWIDGLQKLHSKALGFFPRAQLEGYLASDGVLVAEAPEAPETGEAPVGYVVFRDRYLKRDELGVIYQLCVSPAPGIRRGLIGANLVKAAFERSAYGCRLYCCWCAQDLEANRFWEALGFVPIAFRGGSTKKSRTHIFWQKRIRGGDVGTPWWFPAKTDQGAMRADRLVFPIPPEEDGGRRCRWWRRPRKPRPRKPRRRKGKMSEVRWGMPDVEAESLTRTPGRSRAPGRGRRARRASRPRKWGAWVGRRRRRRRGGSLVGPSPRKWSPRK